VGKGLAKFQKRQKTHPKKKQGKKGGGEGVWGKTKNAKKKPQIECGKTQPFLSGEKEGGRGVVVGPN